MEDYQQQDDLRQAYSLVQEFIEHETESDESNEIYYLIVTLHILLRIKKMSLFSFEDIKSYKELEKYNSSDRKYWYRGQSDYDWKLIPSYYRSLGKKDVIVDYDYLKRDYDEMRISRKLYSIFDDDTIDYEKLSFIQHSLAITPLLDFTRNIYSATSFAVGNYENPRKLSEDNAAVYLIDIESSERITSSSQATSLIQGLRVQYIGSRPRIATLIRSSFWREFLIGTLHSEFHLIDIKTNDRMRIQDGTFVLLDKVLFIGNDLIVSTKEHKVLSKIITKLKISHKDRLSIYKHVMSNDSKHHFLKMMNPYEFMIE
jgi:hypothetical protein